jgi:hypothetical protein
MIYVLYFSNAGVPATGLSPGIVAYKKVSDGSDVASPPAITEIGAGFYKLAATPGEALVVQVDGGAGLANADRYKVMQITPHDGDLDAQVSTRAVEAGGNVAAIKTHTDKIIFDASNYVKSNAQNAQLGNLDAAVSTRALEAGGNLAAVKAKTDNLPASPANEANVETHVSNVLAAYDPPTQAELEAAVAPLALEAGLEAHVIAALSAYDPPTRAEATSDKEAVLAAIAGLNDITVGALLSGDLADNLSFPANSLADLIRKLFWVLCNRLVISDASGDFTAYKSDGVTPAVSGTITDNGATTERSGPTWP